MDADSEVIASRSFVAITRHGDRFDVQLKIGKPYRVSDEEWACPLALDGLHNPMVDIRGVDSLQSLLLAIRMTRSFLKHFIESGGSLHWPDEGTHGRGLHLDQIFGKWNE
jgi:hypothetical protein